MGMQVMAGMVMGMQVMAGMVMGTTRIQTV